MTIRNGNGISIRLITFDSEDEWNACGHVYNEIKIKKAELKLSLKWYEAIRIKKCQILI